MLSNLVSPAAIVIALLMICSSSEGGEMATNTIAFFVATDGNDAWSGTLPESNAGDSDGPFATLGRARDAVRELKAEGGLKQPVEVVIRGGVYFLEEPLRLGAEDSGSEACPITYKAHGDEKVVLSGGRIITKWKPYKGEIMQSEFAEVKDGLWKVRQLFFEGKRQRRARWPDYDPHDPLYGGWAFVRETVPADEERPRSFRCDSEAPVKRWAKPQQGEVFVFPWRCWQNDLVPIEGVDRESGTITMTRDILPGWNPLTKGNRFRVENVLEELDTPGEWCVDTETGTLFFWPPGEGEVSVPVNDRLIEMKGTREAPIAFVGIEGVTFAQTLSLFPARGYAVQSDGCSMYLENAAHCRVANNVFDQVGGDAIRLQNHNAHNEITGNEIMGAGAQGVCFTGSGGGNTHTWRGKIDVLGQMAREKAVAEGNVVSGNHIHHCGALEKHAAGVFFFNINAVDNIVAHNLIHDMPRYGIALQIGLGGNVIEYNDIHRVSLETADTGGIETNRWFVLDDVEKFSRGNVVRYNRVRDAIGCGAYDKPLQPMPPSSRKAGGRIWTPYYSWGIYFDNSPMDVTVYGNIVVGNVLGGIMILGAGKNVVFENNVLVDASRSQLYYSSISTGGDYGPGEGNRFVRNIVAYRDPEALLVRIGKRPTEAIIATSDYNVYFHSGGKPLSVDLPGVEMCESFGKWREFGYDIHSVNADPLFVDPANGDYRLRPDSPALELGFKSIPQERIGLPK